MKKSEPKQEKKEMTSTDKLPFAPQNLFESMEEKRNSKLYSDEDREEIQYIPIDNTCVMAVGTNKGTTWRLTSGGHLVSTKTFPTITEAIDYLETKPWEIITNLMVAIAINIDEVKKMTENDQ